MLSELMGIYKIFASYRYKLSGQKWRTGTKTLEGNNKEETTKALIKKVKDTFPRHKVEILVIRVLRGPGTIE